MTGPADRAPGGQAPRRQEPACAQEATGSPPAAPEATGFLYPFIEAEERDEETLLRELAASARTKAAESARLRESVLSQLEGAIDRAAGEMAERFCSGGRLLTFGNGGSATDADAAAALFRDPPAGRPVAAISLVDDQAVVTALANDVGFDLVFSRQVNAHGSSGDVALAFSTSGGSLNLLRALSEASRRGMLSVAFAGYDGGAMAASEDVRHCLVVRSDSVHRIQEAQSAVLVQLWCAVQRRLAELERR